MNRLAVAILLGLVATPSANAAISLQLAANYDNTRDTGYPNGDKPTGVCTAPTGFTEASLRNGSGEICEQSATEFDINVIGLNNARDTHIAYQDCGGGECQVETRITDSYAGSTATFATIGIGIREDAVESGWLFQIHSMYPENPAVQCTYGSVADGYTSVNGAAGQSRPRFVSATYDPVTDLVKGHASDDGVTWTEVCSVSKVLANDLAYIFGASNSATISLQATIDLFDIDTEITVYDEGGGGPGGGPTLTTPIENQSLTQGVSFALSIAENFSAELSFTIPANGAVGGLPTGSGLSFSTVTGTFTGSPDADDVAASPYNVSPCAVNAGGSTCDTVQFTVAPIPGDVFLIQNSASSRTFNCSSASGAAGATWVSIRTSGSGTTPGPGDHIELNGGSYGHTIFTDCHGQVGGRLSIHPQAGETVTFNKTGSGSGAPLRITDSSDFDFYGGEDDCGTLETWPAKNPSPACGVVVQLSGTAVEPGNYITLNGLDTRFSIEGFEVDCTGGTSGIGIGMQLNDNSEWVSNNPGFWREDIRIENNWIHGSCGNGSGGSASGVGLYLGPNAYGSDAGEVGAGEQRVPHRRHEVAYNQLEDGGSRASMRIKYVQQGPNSYHHNYVEGGGAEAMGIDDGGDAEVYSNIFIDPTSDGFRFQLGNNNKNGPVPYTDDGPFYLHVYNNIIARSGRDCFRVTEDANSDAAWSEVLVYNNTCVNPVAIGVNYASGVSGTKTATDNIITQATTAVSGGTSTSNTTGTNAEQNFAGLASDNYELTATSPACNVAGAATAPALDFEDEARPMDSADDDGADEAAACP